LPFYDELAVDECRHICQLIMEVLRESKQSYNVKST